jgi:hypothetical protein
MMNLNENVTRSVHVHRNQLKIIKQEEYTEFEELYENYDMYKQQDADRKAKFEAGEKIDRPLCGMLGGMSRTDIQDELDTLASEIEFDETLSDPEFIQVCVSKVLKNWHTGRNTFRMLTKLSRSILDLLEIIPQVAEQEHVTGHLALWLHENNTRFWTPVGNADLWEQLQFIYDIFIQPGTQEQIKQTWITTRDNATDRVRMADTSFFDKHMRGHVHKPFFMP